MPDVIFAQDQVPAYISGAQLKEILTAKNPVLVEKNKAEDELRRANAALEALTHMSQMIEDEHARNAIHAQIQAVQAKFKGVEQILKLAPQVSFSAQVDAGVMDKGKGGGQGILRKQVDSAVFSQIWSATEQAAFDEDKVNVIREHCRAHFFSLRQAVLLIETISFSQNRKEALIALYPQVVNPDEAEELFQLLDNDQDQRNARQQLKVRK